MKKITFLFFISILSASAQFNNYNMSNSVISSNMSWFVLQDSNGDIFTATNSGLNKFNPNNNQWTNYTTSNSNIPSNEIHGLAFDNAGNLWIATYGGGLSKFNGTTFTNYNASNSSIGSEQLYHLTYQASANKLWIASRNSGLISFDINTQTFYNYGPSDGLTDAIIDDVDIDSVGNVWLACRYEGVAMFNGTSFVYYTTLSGLLGNEVYSISIAPNGLVWAGTLNGISSFDGNGWTNYSTANSGLSGNYVRQIEFKNSDIWIAMGGGGIQKFDGNTNWTTYNQSTCNIANDSIWSIYLSANGELWAASFGRGLLNMPPEKPSPSAIHETENPSNEFYVYNHCLWMNQLYTDIFIIDMKGQLVFKEKPKGTMLQLPNLPEGIYLASLLDEQGNIHSKKFYSTAE
jgi:ligand-binding sensor domain-containing protein